MQSLSTPKRGHSAGPAQKPVASAILVVTIITAFLSGCSAAGSTTCDQYAAQSYNDRRDTEKSLLAAHNLDKYSVANTVGIVTALNNYCGAGGMGGAVKAGKNGSNTLDKAVDWSSKKW